MTVADYFAGHAGLLLAYAAVLGLIVGSFLNVVIYRLPLMMQRDWRAQCHEFLELPAPEQPAGNFAVFNLADPPSHCPHCKQRIGALENVPVISYLLQGGKCKHCRAPISIRYPLVETATAILTCAVTAYYGYSWLTLALLIFTWTLIALTMIDVDHQLLPDDMTLPLLWLGLLINTQDSLVSLKESVLGAAAGYLVLWGVYWAFKLLTGKEGMGYGDFKLLAALGAWLGWKSLPTIILMSSVVGALVGIALILFKGRGRDVPIPFGPYLASAGYLTLLWGSSLTDGLFALLR
ncbi:MAG TPA: A24 family peptidase [Candidatus Acidoferrum sp.]|nr:A24 family peptidase [Candidatus Acidoferrum sp.]